MECFVEIEPCRRFDLLVMSVAWQVRPEYPKIWPMILLFLLLAAVWSSAASDSESALRAALEEARAYGDRDPRFASAANTLAGTLVDHGKTIEAAKLLTAALPVLEAALGAAHRDVAICRFRLAKCHLRAERYGEAEALLLSAQPALGEFFGRVDPQAAMLLIELGTLYRVTGRGEESEEVLRRAVKTLESTLGIENILTSRSILELGTTYYAMGRHPQAIRVLNRALPAFEKMPAQEESAQFWVNLGNVRFTVGQLKEAEVAWRRALSILDCLPEMEMLKAVALSSLGKLKLAQGRRGQAEPLIVQAAAIAEAQQGKTRDLLPILDTLATLYASRGEPQRADEIYGRALDLALSTMGPSHPDTAVIFQSLGRLRTLQRRFDQAAVLYERALDGLKKSLGERHPLYYSYLMEYAALLRKIKRTPDAKQLEVTARTILEENRAQTLVVNTVDVRELRRNQR